MITLVIEPYCENCPEFESKVDKDIQHMYEAGAFMEFPRVYTVCTTTVTCEHKDRCASIKDQIEIELRNARAKGEVK